MNKIKGVFVSFDTLSISRLALPPPILPGFTWDAETDVSEQYPAQASSHPVQAGARDVTDNVHTGNVVLSVSGLVSTVPFSRPIKLPGTNIDGSVFSSDLAVAMKQLLLTYQRERRRVTITSSKGTWPSCVIGNIDVKWGPATGDSLAINAQFTQIRVARQQLVPAVQDADLLAAGATSGGTSTSSSTSVGSWAPSS